MAPLTAPELDRIHGAGPIEAALTRWYLYNLNAPDPFLYRQPVGY